MSSFRKKFSIFAISSLSLGSIILFQNFVLPSSAKNEFYLDPSQLSNLLVQNNPTLAAWTPNGSALNFFGPGIKMILWGNGQGCDISYANGPLRSAEYLLATDVKTGLQVGVAGSRKIWTPAYPEECDPSLSGYSKIGDTFVHVNADDKNGGIGLYTHNGPQSDGTKSFFTAFDERGQWGKGNNKYIKGNFFSIRNASWRAPQNIFPFASTADEMRINIRQSVPQFKVPAGDLMQAKQQINFTLLNLKCREENRGACQIQYIINMALFRNNPAYFKAEFPNRIWADPEQGGMVIVEGTLGVAGQYSTVADKNAQIKNLWRSMKSRTQHAPFVAKDFDFRMSFQHFKNALNIAVENKNNPDLISNFGTKWDDPNEWIILQTEIAHEVSNQNLSTETAYIGGNFTHLQIGSSTLPSRIPAKVEQAYVNQIAFANPAVEKTYSYNETGKTENGSVGNTVLILNKEAAYAKANISATENGNITLLLSRGPNRGIAFIYVDDVYSTQVNLHSNSYNLHPFHLSTTKGNHEIKIVRSAATTGSDHYIALHNIRAASGVYASSILYNSSSATFAGNYWFEKSGYAVLGQNQASASTLLDNSAGNIVIQAMNGPNRGIADIYINDVYFKSVNLYSSTYKLVDHTLNFPVGKYKVTVKRSGYKSNSASDYYVVLNNIKSK